MNQVSSRLRIICRSANASTSYNDPNACNGSKAVMAIVTAMAIMAVQAIITILSNSTPT